MHAYRLKHVLKQLTSYMPLLFAPPHDTFSLY